MEKKFLGIDPGLRGGIALIGGKEPFVQNTPVFSIKNKGSKKFKTYYDVNLIKKMLDDLQPDFICLEKSQAYPDQGSVSNWSTGFGYGLWSGLLVGMGLKYMIVHPRSWQREFFFGMSGDSKALSYTVACQLFPEYAKFLTGPRGGRLDGCSDSLLICEFGKRKYTGKIADKK
jgi:hypothetical protein